EGKYLVEDYQVTVAPSATVYLVCSEKSNHTAGMDREHLLAVGNPDFDRSAFPELSPLQATQAQVEDIARLYTSDSPVVLTGPRATKPRVRVEAANADVIHIASHYKVYPGRPMNSRLLLARTRADSTADSSAGFLRADEVYGLRLRRAPVVVLSACDS